MRPFLVFLALLLPALAHAAPEEIQVYMDEMGAPGEFGLDVHNNYVASGSADAGYPGGQSPLHRYRVTPELAYGLTQHLELGAYLPLLTVDGNGKVAAQGVKARLKFLAPRASGAPWWWGLNLEVGKSAHAVDENPWNAELKTIVGTRAGRWLLAANINVDSALSGPHAGPVTLDVDSKFSYRVNDDLQLGLESYNGLGPLSHPDQFTREDQVLYAVADTHVGKWDLDIGVGRGYAGAQDRWIIKVLVGVPIH